MANPNPLYGFMRIRLLLDASQKQNYPLVTKLLQEFIPAFKITDQKQTPNTPTQLHELKIGDLDILQFFIKLLADKKHNKDIYEIINIMLSNDCFAYDAIKFKNILEDLLKKKDYKTVIELNRSKKISQEDSQSILRSLWIDPHKDILKILEIFKINFPDWELLSLIIEIKKNYQKKLDAFDPEELQNSFKQLEIIATSDETVNVSQLFVENSLLPLLNLALAGNLTLIETLLADGETLDLTIRKSGEKARKVWIKISMLCKKFEDNSNKDKAISQQQYENYSAILERFKNHRSRSNTVANMYKQENQVLDISSTSSTPEPKRKESTSSIATDYSSTPEEKDKKSLDIEEISQETTDEEPKCTL